MNRLVHSLPTTEKPSALRPKKSTPAKNRAAGQRVQDPEKTKADILKVATLEFGEKGLAGGRIDAIAAATQTSKRMLYYYFGSKEGLYLAALEHSYRKVREMESALHLDDMEPVAALRCLVTVSFDHHMNNENYIRLVMSENINRGRYLAQSPNIQELNRPVISTLRAIYERGVAAGVFRSGLDPADIHASISALAFFNVSNRHTFGLIFQVANQSPSYIANRRENVNQMILRYVSKA
jgi:AcrR family transcriptional regulator